jgi:hypothetical protein
MQIRVFAFLGKFSNWRQKNETKKRKCILCSRRHFISGSAGVRVFSVWPDWTNFRLLTYACIGRLLTLGIYFKITEVSHIFGILYSTVEFMHHFWRKMGWATCWVIFPTNPSGHPVFFYSAWCFRSELEFKFSHQNIRLRILHPSANPIWIIKVGNCSCSFVWRAVFLNEHYRSNFFRELEDIFLNQPAYLYRDIMQSKNSIIFIFELPPSWRLLEYDLAN